MIVVNKMLNVHGQIEIKVEIEIEIEISTLANKSSTELLANTVLDNHKLQ